MPDRVSAFKSLCKSSGDGQEPSQTDGFGLPQQGQQGEPKTLFKAVGRNSLRKVCRMLSWRPPALDQIEQAQGQAKFRGNCTNIYSIVT
jgi:hypothetical protein